MFLAQELRSSVNSPATDSSNPARQSGAAAKQSPIWAIEFSKDGKYIAAGGQDKVVRVWAVISSPDERRAHEHEESGPVAPEDEQTHLSAPVFQQKAFREYQGHEATILDLSWSKVGPCTEKKPNYSTPNINRTIFCSLHQWIKPYDYGT